MRSRFWRFSAGLETELALLTIVTNNYPPEAGGIQRLMSRIAGELAARKVDVRVVAPSMIGSADFDRGAPYRIIRYPIVTQRFLGMLAMVIPFVRSLAGASDKVTVASVWWPPGVVVAFAPRWLRGRFAIFAHGSEIAPSRRGMRHLFMRFVYSRADAILSNSSFTEELLRSAGVSNNVHRVTLAVDVEPIEPARLQTPTILSVGRLIERKGFDRTIEAVAKLIPAFPSLRYVIVGNGPQREELQALTVRLGVAENVVFRGKTSDQELRDCYAEAWVFCLAARRIIDDVEGFGLVYLEAAMASLPSVGGIDSGAIDAIVDGQTGILVDGSDTNDIANALSRLLSNPELCSELGRNAQSRAICFSWKRTVDEMLEAVAR